MPMHIPQRGSRVPASDGVPELTSKLTCLVAAQPAGTAGVTQQYASLSWTGHIYFYFPYLPPENSGQSRVIASMIAGRLSTRILMISPWAL